MAGTTTSDLLDREILTDAVKSVLRGKNALMGSTLVSSGAMVVNGTMPESGPAAIGKNIRIPYWGRLGSFASNPEGSSATVSKVGMGYEDATVARASMAFETSRWATGYAASLGMDDPYMVAAEQIVEEAQREMDRQMVAAGSGSALLSNHYSATTPSYMNYSTIVSDKAIKLGDEQGEGIVALVTHSLVMADMANEKDANGNPILTIPSDGTVARIAGVPIIQSDRVSLTGSTMGTVTSTGTSPPGITLSGTPTGPWELHVDIVGAGTVGVATFRFSTDGGNTWSATLTTAASVALTDTAVDSLVGNNGATGVTVAFTAGTHAADNLYTSTANLCVETQIWMRGAGAYWYNESALELLGDADILEDTTINAMHLYACPHVYRRRMGGSRPGVLRVKTNVRNFVG